MCMTCLFCDWFAFDWDILSDHMLLAHKGEELPEVDWGWEMTFVGDF